MRIAILSKMNHRGGGASRAAEILVAGLRAQGHHAVLFTIRAHEPVPHNTPVFPAAIRRPLAYLHSGSEIVTGQVLLPFEYLFLRRRLRGFDLVHLQDTWTAFSPLTARWIAQRWPTCWTFHDCSAFTGGCLYMFDCERHKVGCGSCPRKRQERSGLRRVDCTAASLRWKRRVHRGGRYHLMAPSRWMAQRATESGVFGGAVEVIPYGVDVALFTPERRMAARAQLGIAADERVVLLAATSLEDPRKGAAHGMAALQTLARDGVRATVLTMGRGSETIARGLSLRTIALGHVGEVARAADAFAAADVLLFPTRADNLPLSVQESMACGTPVVAYAVGGVPEMIRDGETGVLVADGNVDGLSAGLAHLLRDAARCGRMSTAAAAHARAEWAIDTYCNRHVEFYERILARA